MGNFNGRVLCVDIRAEAAGAPVVWSYEGSGEAFFSAPAVAADRIVAGSRDKRLHCIDKAGGAGLWSFAARDNIDGAPVVCGDKVVVGSNDGRLYLVRLADGAEAGVYDVGAAISASPAVAPGLLVVGADDGFVYAFAW